MWQRACLAFCKCDDTCLQSQYLEDRGRKNKCLPLHSLCSTSNQTQDLVHARTSTLSTETHHQHLNILHLFSCLKYLFIIPHSSPLFLQEKTKQTPLPPPHSLCSVYHYTQPHAGCPMHSVPLCSASCNIPCAQGTPLLSLLQNACAQCAPMLSPMQNALCLVHPMLSPMHDAW